MSDANYIGFNTRLKKIRRSHRRMSNGYVRMVERDGLLVPVAKSRLSLGFPYRGLMLLVAGILLFKAVLLASLGAGIYDQKLAGFADGSTMEKIGAWVMQADPATRWLAGQIGQLF